MLINCAFVLLSNSGLALRDCLWIVVINKLGLPIRCLSMDVINFGWKTLILTVLFHEKIIFQFVWYKTKVTLLKTESFNFTCFFFSGFVLCFNLIYLFNLNIHCFPLLKKNFCSSYSCYFSFALNFCSLIIIIVSNKTISSFFGKSLSNSYLGLSNLISSMINNNTFIFQMPFPSTSSAFAEQRDIFVKISDYLLPTNNSSIHVNINNIPALHILKYYSTKLII